MREASFVIPTETAASSRRERVEDDADLDLVIQPCGDGDAEVGDTIEIVHGSVDGIDDPLPRAGLVPGYAFFSVDGVIWEGFQNDVRDQVLRFDVEIEFDVVPVCGCDVERGAKV